VNNIRYLTLFVFVFSVCGCIPTIPGVEVPTKPVSWKRTLTGSAQVLDKQFDAQGNAYLLGTYFDNAVSKMVYELTKIDRDGAIAWKTTGLVDIDSSVFWIEKMRPADLLFDSLGNIYIMGAVRGHDNNNQIIFHAVFSAKVLNSGSIEWQNKQVIADLANRDTWLDGALAVVSSNDKFFVAVHTQTEIRVLSFDALGTATTLYTLNHLSGTPHPTQFQLKADTLGDLYLFQGYTNFQPTRSSESLIVHLSETGQVLHRTVIPSLGDDFVINPDQTFTILYMKHVRKFTLTGTLLWEQNITFNFLDECNGFYVFQRMQLASDETLHVLYKYACSSETPSHYYQRGGYQVVKLDALGQESGRIIRELPIKSDEQYGAIGPEFLNGFAYADFQLDRSDNLYVSEQYLTGSIWFIIYYVYDVLNITTLTRKYDPSGALVQEVRAPAVRRNLVDLGLETLYSLGQNMPFYIGDDGALSLFIQSQPDKISNSVIPNYKHILMHYRTAY
jgi:hypothetical protein